MGMNTQAIMAGYQSLPIGKQPFTDFQRKNEFLQVYATKGKPDLTQPESRDENHGMGVYYLA